MRDPITGSDFHLWKWRDVFVSRDLSATMSDRATLSETDFSAEQIGDVSCEQIRSEGPTILELFEVLSRSRGLEVLAQFADEAGPWRFKELETQLSIPPNTLTRRLQELEEFGLLTREVRETVPPYVQYTATESASELQPVLQYLYRWSMRKHGRSTDSTADKVDGNNEIEEQ